MNIMSYEVFVGDLENIDLLNKNIVNTINPHSYITAKNDKLFESALRNSDLLIPDGTGIVLAAKMINKKIIKKISGADLHKFLLKKMNLKNGKVFYMGSSKNTLEKIEARIKKEYPNITVESYSPPFKPEFTQHEDEVILKLINEFKPNVLFIGMTAPKQEKWLHTHKDNLEFNVASSIGAVFDFYAETTKRPSQIWLNLHLEWLLRFLYEPKRLWRRNFISTPLFIIEILKFKMR